MLSIARHTSLNDINIPFGIVEVHYPEPNRWCQADFRALVQQELTNCRQRFATYERKAVFGENPYVRFFKRFRKTYPVLLQFESIILKGQPFPEQNFIAEVPFLMELTTHVLSGAHDADQLCGAVELYLAAEKEPFIGLHERELHTYPGDFCARDESGIIFSQIAGTDARTAAWPDSCHVFYPIFGTPDLPRTVIDDAINVLSKYIQILAPEAQIESAFV